MQKNYCEALDYNRQLCPSAPKFYYKGRFHCFFDNAFIFLMEKLLKYFQGIHSAYFNLSTKCYHKHQERAY